MGGAKKKLKKVGKGLKKITKVGTKIAGKLADPLHIAPKLAQVGKKTLPMVGKVAMGVSGLGTIAGLLGHKSSGGGGGGAPGVGDSLGLNQPTAMGAPAPPPDVARYGQTFGGQMGRGISPGGQ